MVTAPEASDVDRLPPTQYLVLETLAARCRMGELAWTFPRSVVPALRALDGLGLVRWKVTGPSTLAWLTELGQAACLADTYRPPVRNKVVQHLADHQWGTNDASRHSRHDHHWDCAICVRDVARIVDVVLNYRQEEP